MFSFIRRWFPFLATPELRAAEPIISADSSLDPQPADSALAGEEPSDGWWVPNGAAVLAAPPPEPDAALNLGLYEQLVAVLDDAHLEIPRMPQVAQRALLVLRDENANYREVADLVGQDPALTAEVLRVTNSVAYRGVREIRSLELAFARLGVRSLRSIILGASFKGLAIRTGGPERTLGEELWRRALAGAVTLRHFSRRFGVPEDEAFLIGLLHDVGLLVALKVVYEYQRCHGRAVARPVFERVGREWHEHIGMRLAEAWNLPDPLPILIGNHHHEPSDDDPLRTQRLLIHLADACCAMLAYDAYVPYDFFNLPCVQRLGLQNDAATRAELAALPALLDDMVNRT